jgi:hypothetical protein
MFHETCVNTRHKNVNSREGKAVQKYTRMPEVGTDVDSHPYFVIHDSDSDSTHKYSEIDIKKMLDFLIDNIFVVFGNQVFQPTV